MSFETENYRDVFIYGDYNNVNIAAFVQYLADSVDVLSLWNHLPLLYCVKTRLTVSSLRAKISPFFQGNHFIVIELFGYQVDGNMTGAAWEWFITNPPSEKRQSNLANLFALSSSPQNR